MIAYLLDGVISLDIPSAEATIVKLDSRITELISLGLNTEQPDGVEPLLKLKVDHHERLLEEADAYEYSINRGLRIMEPDWKQKETYDKQAYIYDTPNVDLHEINGTPIHTDNPDLTRANWGEIVDHNRDGEWTEEYGWIVNPGEWVIKWS